VSNLLRHPLTGEWVLYAPSRGDRPGAFESRRPRTRTPREQCPFCPGNEHETPPEIYRTGSAERWKTRVVPNRYPAITAVDGGAHEVVIESPDHDVRFHSLSVEQAQTVIDTWQLRHQALSLRGDIAFVTIFKNDGPDSGQSIDHLHSQIVALPTVPTRAALIANGFGGGSCPLCQVVLEPLLLRENETFTAVAPPVALYPYEIWILPKRHVASLAPLSLSERTDLAHLMQNASEAFARVLDDSSFNWILHTSPLPERAEFHWFVQAFPRLAQQGGFELGTGMQINIVEMARAVEELREAMNR
jgi:UDPglucose--hexose-1-phosphate uridylyltransferase